MNGKGGAYEWRELTGDTYRVRHELARLGCKFEGRKWWAPLPVYKRAQEIVPPIGSYRIKLGLPGGMGSRRTVGVDCPNCGEWVPRDWKACGECGWEVPVGYVEREK